jgi:hypothetical protein
VATTPAEIRVSSGPVETSRAFAHPPLVRSLAMFAALFCAGGCLFSVVLPFLAPTRDTRLLVVCGLVLFGPSLYLSLAMVRRSHDTVAIADDGIRYHSPNAPASFIPWNEIASVQPQNVMQRLLVADFDGTRKIHLEYHLEDFGELRRIVLERATKRTDEAA